MKRCASSGCIEDQHGNITVEKMAIIKRWSKCIEELFHDDRVDKPKFHKKLDGQKVLQSEVRVDIIKAKRNK